MSELKPIPEKSYEVFELVQSVGGNITTLDLAEKLDTNIRSITPRITALVKRGLVVRREEFVAGGEDGKQVRLVYVDLTEEGEAWVQPEPAVKE